MKKYTNPQLDFEVFKSNICHTVKDKGDLDFIIELLQADDIRTYWNQKQYPEALYLLAMLDYLSRINEIPLCTRYDDMRKCSLDRMIYPKDVILLDKLMPEKEMKKQSVEEGIPEFLRFHIIEAKLGMKTMKKRHLIMRLKMSLHILPMK